MGRKTKRILAAVMCLTLLCCSLPATAYGASKTVSGTIDLSSTKDLKGSGYYWNAAGHTLTLEDADLTASGQPVFKLNKAGDTKIVLTGDSKISCDDAAAISSTGGGRLTISGTGTLTIEGYVYINSAEVTITNCQVNIIPAGETEEFRSFTNSGDGNLIITGDASVTLGDGLSICSDESSLIINGASLTAYSNYEGATVEVGSDITVKNGGQLTVMEPAEEDEDTADSDSETGDGDRIAETSITETAVGVCAGGSIYFDETSLVNISRPCGTGIQILNGDLQLESQEMEIFGGLQAVSVAKKGSEPVVSVPEEEGWIYSTACVNDGKYSNRTYWATIYDPDVNKKPSYSWSKKQITGGSCEIKYTSEAVTQAREILEQTSLEVSAKAYAKTSSKSRRIRVSWTSSGETAGGVTGYQISRANSKKGTYKLFFTTANSTYCNTASLTKGKTYYYKVRPYIQVNDTLYYGEWSEPASATAK